jgi:hypothetical protein
MQSIDDEISDRLYKSLGKKLNDDEQRQYSSTILAKYFRSLWCKIELGIDANPGFGNPFCEITPVYYTGLFIVGGHKLEEDTRR